VLQRDFAKNRLLEAGTQGRCSPGVTPILVS
jgi:hypothetical protein